MQFSKEMNTIHSQAATLFRIISPDMVKIIKGPSDWQYFYIFTNSIFFGTNNIIEPSINNWRSR